jgi:rod shape-determining protein MreC
VDIVPWFNLSLLMRNVFLFLRRFFTFFAFLALQAVSLWFLFNYNRFHRAKGLGMANEVTGWFNTKYNKVEDYFFLKEENRRINRFNDSLLNLLPSNFLKQDTSAHLLVDSIPYDTLGHYRRFLLRDATVVYNTVNSQKNYIQLNRGSNQGIKDNMGVISSDGCAVGVVVNVSPNFSQVMSLLHVQSSTSASLKKSNEFGTVEWDGDDPRFVYLRRLPKSVDVKMGDTVLTSAYSFTLPPGYMVGTVEDVKVDNKTGMYVLKLRTATNFYTLQQVHVIENLQGDEQRKLLSDTRKQNEDSKNNPR